MTNMANNRRKYFRIDDRIRLSYKTASGLKNQVTYNADCIDMPSRAQLRELDGELNTLLNTLWRSEPVTAKVIGLLNRKINIISSAIDLDIGNADEHDEREIVVNISGCGMAFNCAESFPKGQLLELQITLLPSETVLRLIARVEACEPAPEGSQQPYRLRVEFATHYSDAQEQLIQHLVQRQAAQLAAEAEAEQRREEVAARRKAS